MKRSFLVLLLSPIIIFTFVSASYSSYTIVQLTNTAYWEDYPQINSNGYVVWQGGGIWLYDGATTTQISASGLRPQINDNGWVVWTGCDGADCWGGDGDWEIFLYDGVNTTQLTNNAYDDEEPQINDNGEVVWWGWDGSDYEIFLYNDRSTTQLTDNDYDDDYPQINDNGYVVWDLRHGGSGGIWLYDGATTTQISAFGFRPQINDNGHVVWQGSGVPTTEEIFLYDGTSTTQLTDNAYGDYAPQINNNGYVVWWGYGGGSGTWLYDGATSNRIYADIGLGYQINDNGYVIWYGLDEGYNGEIFLAKPTGYSSVANAEAATYGSSSLIGSGAFNSLTLILVPVGGVILLRILRRKR